MPTLGKAASLRDGRETNVIYEGDTVICETSDGRIFFQVVKKNDTIRVGKKLTPLKPVIGATYGSIFEEQNKKLVLVDGGLFPDPVAPEVGEFDVPDGDNRDYTDTNSAQRLSNKEIAGLRESGVSGQEIIQKLVENSETWESKNEFSKQKYLKKKQQKYMPRVRFLKCTADSLCRTYRTKNPTKICNIREDSLGQILMYGNIHANAQVLIVDTCMGLVIGAVAERQNGLGRIIAGYEGQQLSGDILRRFNFDKSTLEAIHTFPLNTVKYLEVAEADIPATDPIHRERLSDEEKRRLEEERLAQYTEEEQQKYFEKKAKRAAEKLHRQPAEQVRAWLREQSDSLIIASHFDPQPILLALLPYLKCSRPFVIYCEYLEPLTRIFNMLQKMTSIVDVQLNETWTREYQILPGRTHPEMKMNAFSGYLLTGLKVGHIDAPTLRAQFSASAIASDKSGEEDVEPPTKKQKTDAGASA
ncbi:hypothetical protein Poli38472_011449 [Pythium oligandrum]|uniref:tRNA (adenine(58)-N(1))-methyltransferase non-catalytic subunit TRM6 n=1 Tax=Pythium oligandrum TaxID=41045 RepID=A0A8K1CJ77_PYTOL|nr:hypothetical protein Poli38472_011449 [Pythium oligandrum]|eukprot:TMW64569.1 hypothetical protein Poli38472_011449 [Pythium oligandrum]